MSRAEGYREPWPPHRLRCHELAHVPQLPRVSFNNHALDEEKKKKLRLFCQQFSDEERKGREPICSIFVEQKEVRFSLAC
jgi:hypothetical protein